MARIPGPQDHSGCGTTLKVGSSWGSIGLSFSFGGSQKDPFVIISSCGLRQGTAVSLGNCLTGCPEESAV